MIKLNDADKMSLNTLIFRHSGIKVKIWETSRHRKQIIATNYRIYVNTNTFRGKYKRTRGK